MISIDKDREKAHHNSEKWKALLESLEAKQFVTIGEELLKNGFHVRGVQPAGWRFRRIQYGDDVSVLCKDEEQRAAVEQFVTDFALRNPDYPNVRHIKVVIFKRPMIIV